MAWTTLFLLTFVVIPVFPVLALVFNSGPNAAVELQRRNEEWGPITVLPLILLGNPLAPEQQSEWGRCAVFCLLWLLVWTNLLGCCCLSIHFNRNMELWNHLGWTFRVHLVQPPLPWPGTSSTDQVAQGPIQPDFEHWIAAGLLWPFSLLRLAELTGSVARN